MTLRHLQHFLIQTTDVEGTTKWFEDVLGLKRGPHPDFKFPVEWLYIGDTDVLHLTQGGAGVSEERKQYLEQTSQATHGTGVLDHVAFRADGLKDTLDHLRAKGVAFQTRQVDNAGLFQIFLHDPNGVKIELNFENSEAKGIKPELLASDLGR
jgi:catechol 2,3-dioxygenase-like lactoylglutathione lyase family enzyme